VPRDAETYKTVGTLESGTEMAGCSRNAHYGSTSARVVWAAEVEGMTEEEQQLEWERQEEQHDFTEACVVANRNEWVTE